jgi:hypothetical protein
MNDQHLRKDIITFFIVIIVLFGFLAGLKYYDYKYGEIDKLGTSLYTRFVHK